MRGAERGEARAAMRRRAARRGRKTPVPLRSFWAVGLACCFCCAARMCAHAQCRYRMHTRVRRAVVVMKLLKGCGAVLVCVFYVKGHGPLLRLVRASAASIGGGGYDCIPSHVIEIAFVA